MKENTQTKDSRCKENTICPILERSSLNERKLSLLIEDYEFELSYLREHNKQLNDNVVQISKDLSLLKKQMDELVKASIY